MSSPKTAAADGHEVHQNLPILLNHLSASPTNPRKRFDQAKIDELAASIAEHQLLQPILARPFPGAPIGRQPLEIVAGERRWRACLQLADKGINPHGKYIPCIVRPLSDRQVLEIQLAENIQRTDLHPLEEAEHYRRMRDQQPNPMSVDEIAHAAGKSASHVYQRLTLLQLVPDARAAFERGQLSAQTAQQVARLPKALQGEATEHLIDWGGEPMGPKAAAAFLKDRYMLLLSHAPFDPADAALVPSAGACTDCPKRSGANPQLFADITDADTCTDTECFGIKKRVHAENAAADEAEDETAPAHEDEAEGAEDRPAPPDPEPPPPRAASKTTTPTPPEPSREFSAPGVDDDLVDEILSFPSPPLKDGKYGWQPADEYIAMRTARAKRILIAAAAVSSMQNDGAEGLPQEGLAHMLLTILLRRCESHLGVDEAARLAGVDAPPEAVVRDRLGIESLEWAFSMPDEEAARLCVALLATHDEMDEPDCDRFPETIALALGIDTSGFDVMASESVRKNLQAGAA